MLGHCSAVMTLDLYGHLMPGRAEDLANSLDQVARAAKPAKNAPVDNIGRANTRAIDHLSGPCLHLVRGL